MIRPPTRPGPRNLITDVDGIGVGNAHDEKWRSGATVILPARPALAAVDVRGGGPGTRETDLLSPLNRVDRVDAIVLAGGSVFGLDAASGVAHWLHEHGCGLEVRGIKVPLVPGAILFDLANGGDKSWPKDAKGLGEPPYRALGRAACEAATQDFALGNAGAGYGALAGQLKGGLGSASAISPDGLQVGALVAANPIGSVVDHRTGAFWAQHDAYGAELGPTRLFREGPDDLDLPPDTKLGLYDTGLESNLTGASTSIGVIATNAKLGKAEAARLATMAHDGLARAIRPVHTPLDGDTLFVLATGAYDLGEPRDVALTRLGHLAAGCVARAVGRAVLHAASLGAMKSWRERYGAD